MKRARPGRPAAYPAITAAGPARLEDLRQAGVVSLLLTGSDAVMSGVDSFLNWLERKEKTR